MTSSEKAIFLIRHTQTTWNTESRYQGRIDSRLSPEGLADVKRIVAAVQPGDFGKVYTSPLSRARTLAEALAGSSGAPLVADPRLIEIAMGPWEGLLRSEIELRFGEMLTTWHDHPDEVAFPDGETLADVAARIREFMEELFADPDEERVAVVSHDAVIKVALMLSLGLELRHLHSFRIRNGSVSVLRGRKYRGAVEAVDVTSHLTGSPFQLPH